MLVIQQSRPNKFHLSQVSELEGFGFLVMATYKIQNYPATKIRRFV